MCLVNLSEPDNLRKMIASGIVWSQTIDIRARYTAAAMLLDGNAPMPAALPAEAEVLMERVRRDREEAAHA